MTEPGFQVPDRAGRPWRILQGDALTVLRELPSGCVDAIVTDPPYSSGGMVRSDRSRSPKQKYVTTDRQTRDARPDFSGDNRDQRSFALWATLWMSECLRVAKPGAPICVFTDWRQLPVVADAIQAGGWVWRGIVSWDKTFGGEGCRPAMGRFAAQCEFVVWGSAGVLPEREDVGCLHGAITAPRLRGVEQLHVTQKPVPVMRMVVRICPPGGVVLDPFTGSGSTGVAALAQGRRFLGIELSSEYAEIAARRLEEVKP